VIVGGGLAGAKAAEELRVAGFDGQIVLIADEAALPYERPPLSKSYLAGDSTLADAQVHDEGFYAAQRIGLLTSTRASALDTSRRRVTLSDGEQLAYDRLLIATGATPRRPPIPGAEGERVLVLRSAGDADVLRTAIGGGGHLVIVGAGWIGCEVAATARGLGADVTMVELGSTPLERVLGPRLGDFFAQLHRGHGVDLLTGSGVSRIEGGGRAVRLADGRSLDCDAVLLAAGVAPSTALAQGAGITVDDGILADERLRTSDGEVFAAGDVASVMHPRYGRHVRVEHWDNAQAQGAAAARSMLDDAQPYSALPYFFSDQYDLGLEYVGMHDPADQVVIRGSLDEPAFQVFWLAPDGTGSAGMHVNDWDAIDPIRALVSSRATVEPARLADTGHPLDGERHPCPS
jgi:3-phenylpropionate/trans-cinnamate dioxygenase ferredoxin reductase subunit